MKSILSSFLPGVLFLASLCDARAAEPAPDATNATANPLEVLVDPFTAPNRPTNGAKFDPNARAAERPSSGSRRIEPGRGSSRSRHLRDRVAVMNNLEVREGEAVADAIGVGCTADINGAVEGDLVLVLSKARLGPSTDVKGDLVVVGAQIEADPGVRIGGDRIVVGGAGSDLLGAKWLKWPQEWIAHGALYGRALPPQHGWAWAAAGLSLLLYALVTVLFPKPVLASVEALSAQPGRAFLLGLLALVMWLPVLALLAVTGIGLLLIPFVLVLAVVVCLFGKAAFYSFAGQQVGRHFHWSILQQPATGLIVGAIGFCLLYTIPVVGLLLWALVLPLGVGSVLQALAVRLAERAELARSAAGVTGGAGMPVAAGMPAAASPAEALPPGSVVAATLPRAGFWIRLLATLLDLTLVGIVCAFLGVQNWFFLIWVAYHVAFWTWKSTTIGGILLSLKIIRTSGAPIDFTVALVRSLASIFSFVVLGLGFVWVGWSAEKQSWHDRIVDTVIVRMPKGTSLF